MLSFAHACNMSSTKDPSKGVPRRKAGKDSKNEKSHSKKRSLSRSLQNLFHRKNSYSLKPDGNVKGKKLFDPINDANGGNGSDSAHGTRMSRAQVWLVRNSMSKSPVEDIGLETGRYIELGLEQRKNSGNKTFSHDFDTLKHVEQFLHVNKESTISKDLEEQYNQSKQSVRKETLQDNHDVAGDAFCKEASEKLTEDWDRSRLSSFGSSGCYTDSGHCCHSTSNCSCSTRGRSDSSALLDDDVSTSYWDIHLPSETAMDQEYPYERYHRSTSLCVQSVAKSTFGSQDDRISVAKKRLSMQMEPSYYRTPVAEATTDQLKTHCHKDLSDESRSPNNRAKRRLSVQQEPFYYRTPVAEAITDRLKKHCHSQKDLTNESGSQNNRVCLAKRRLSVQQEPSYYRTPVSKATTDQLKTHCHSHKDLSNEYTIQNLSEFVEGKENHNHNNNSQVQKQRSNEIRRSRSTCCDMRRSGSMGRNQRHQEHVEMSKKRICFTRSRSVGSSLRRSSFTSRERQHSFNALCQFAFSDIEGSESEEEIGLTPEPKDTSTEGKQQSTSSTPEPKDTSSEGKLQSTSNDSSSLSACSLSGYSSSERNTPNTKKKGLIQNTNIGQDGFQVKYNDTEIVGSADSEPLPDDVSNLIEYIGKSKALESSYRETCEASELPHIKANLSNCREQSTLANTEELVIKTELEIDMEDSFDKLQVLLQDTGQTELVEIKKEITLKNSNSVTKSDNKDRSAKVQIVVELEERQENSCNFENLVEKKVDDESDTSINNRINEGDIVITTSYAVGDNPQNMLEKSLVTIPSIEITPPMSEFFNNTEIEGSSTDAEGTAANRSNKITGDIFVNTFDSDHVNMSMLKGSSNVLCLSNEEKVEESVTKVNDTADELINEDFDNFTCDNYDVIPVIGTLADVNTKYVKQSGAPNKDATQKTFSPNAVAVIEVRSDQKHDVTEDATDEVLDANRVPVTEISSDIHHDSTEKSLDAGSVVIPVIEVNSDNNGDATLDVNPDVIPVIGVSSDIKHDTTEEVLDGNTVVILVIEIPSDVHHNAIEETLDSDAVVIPMIEASSDRNQDIIEESLDANSCVMPVTEFSSDVHYHCNDKQREDTFANEETDNDSGTLNADLAAANYVPKTEDSTEKQDLCMDTKIQDTHVALVTDTANISDSSTQCEYSCIKEDIITVSTTDTSTKDDSEDMLDANTVAIHTSEVGSNAPDLCTDIKIEEKGTESGTVHEIKTDLPTRSDETVLATKYDAVTEIRSDATNLPFDTIRKIPAALLVTQADSVKVGPENPEIHFGTSIEDLGTDVDMIMMNHYVTEDVMDNEEVTEKEQGNEKFSEMCETTEISSREQQNDILARKQEEKQDLSQDDKCLAECSATMDITNLESSQCSNTVTKTGIKTEFESSADGNDDTYLHVKNEDIMEEKNISPNKNLTDTHNLEELMKDLDTEGLNISEDNSKSVENNSINLTKQDEELYKNGDTEMNNIIVYFENVSEELLDQACKLGVAYIQEMQTNNNAPESSENTTQTKDSICNVYNINYLLNTQNKASDTDITDESLHLGMTEPEFAMTDKSIQVEEPRVENRNLEFRNVTIDEILFCSGKQGESACRGNDVDAVFEAINKEAAKEENKGKDMLVMFIVGGEVKVLRRSGSSASGGHADYTRTDIPSMTRIDTPQQNGSRDIIFTRSVHNVNRGRPKSAVIVTRSQSFNGMAHQPSGIGVRQHHVGPPAVVLGESFRHHRAGPQIQARTLPGSRGAVGFSFKKSPKVPKVPRPNRALLMFQSVKRGVREFIEATKEDLEQLQHRETDHTSTAQQMKSAERYMKRLEFHLAKLDELHEYYLLQQQLREGVRTMHRAYVTSPGNQSHSLSNVKYGYKECTQTMCNIEAQLEAMMGTFSCKLKGMAGFARLCPGDVFEVTVRHGTQKWKTKGRIEKTGNQKWDIPEFTFKAVVGDIFNIKGLEVRAFKSVLLGQKSCETKDLFSANPQLMTVSINVNGSLKLSIVITWNPLDGVEENFTFVETPTRPQGTPRKRPVSVIALNGQFDEEQLQTDRRFSGPVMVQQTKDDNFILRNNAPSHNTHNVTAYHGFDSPHVAGSRLSDHLPDAYKQTGPLLSQTSHHIQAGFHSSPAIPMSAGDSDSSKHGSQPQTQHSAFKHSVPQGVMGHLHFPSVSPHIVSSSTDDEHSVLNIEDILHNLSSSLEDYHGQYSELQKLEELIKYAHKLIRKQFRSSSRSSSISVSIESALEAFDFLDTEDAFEEPKSPTEHTKASFDDMLCSPESTAKTGDSGIESLAQRLSEDTQLGSSLGSSPVPPSTGNEEVDQCLMYHLTYCERLLENLGAFGPLKCREIYALDKLQKQSTIIEGLLKLAKAGPHVDLHNVMSHICEDKSLREFWAKCTDQTSLYIHPDRLLNMLEQKYSSVITEQHMIDATKVCQHIITRVLDIPDYEAERGRSWFVMTLHQFMLYFKDEGGLTHVEDVAKEMKLVERLTSGNSDMVIKAILTLRDTLPSSPCLKVIGMLLVTMDTEVEQCTISYFNLIQKKQQNRDKAMVTFLEGLEDRTPEIRAGACSALAILEASESIDQLVYLWQSDVSPLVQKKAKEALLTLGDEGRKAFEDAQLSKHGFQGIQVHK